MHNTYQGYCAIQWKQSSSTSPDPYQVGYKATSTIDNTDCGPTSEYGAFTSIPGLSHDQSLAPKRTILFKVSVPMVCFQFLFQMGK